jgi:hypothetical protein
VGVGERVHAALKLAHVDQFFRFFDSLSDAQAKTPPSQVDLEVWVRTVWRLANGENGFSVRASSLRVISVSSTHRGRVVYVPATRNISCLQNQISNRIQEPNAIRNIHAIESLAATKAIGSMEIGNPLWQRGQHSAATCLIWPPFPRSRQPLKWLPLVSRSRRDKL